MTPSNSQTRVEEEISSKPDTQEFTTPDPAAVQALHELPKQLEEAWAYLLDYLQARWEGNKASFRNGLVTLGLAFLLFFLLGGTLLIAVAFVFYGTALVLGELLGGRPWAGYLISGASLLLLAGVLTRWKLVKQRRNSLQKKVQEYEQELQKQKTRFGTNAEERAAAPN